MKAALLVAPGKIVVDDVPEPEIGPGDVAVRIGGVGLCGSDISVFSGKWLTPAMPWIMGHEAFGSVVAVGEGISPARTGETVVVEPNLSCFDCPPCARGFTSACENRRSIGMNRQGALAELLVLPARFAWPVSGLAPETLVTIEPLTVVVAALRRLDRPLPSSALVVGAGPQGLLMALALMSRGVSVDVHELNAQRATFASSLGASLAVAATSYELVVDSVGSPAANEFAVAHCIVGGVVLVLGLDDRPLGISAQTLVRRQLELRGSLTYDHPSDFAATIGLVSAGTIDPGTIVAHAFSLDEAQAAFEQSATAPGKTWIRMTPDPIDEIRSENA